MDKANDWAIRCVVAPVRERGLKLSNGQYAVYMRLVAPVRERGLKYKSCKKLQKVVESLP